MTLDTLDFVLPPELEASEPPEARGLTRDAVRLLVSYCTDNRITHSQFRQLPDFLQAGDVLVINTSGTLNAALNVIRESDEMPFELHLSTRLSADRWVVELRESNGKSTKPYYAAQPGEILQLPAGGQATLEALYNPESPRLWTAILTLPEEVQVYLKHYGFPIRYSYVKQGWSNIYYQTVYATEMGSAEMPSAGRAFTPELITRLVAMGVQIVPLILHTGVASLEDHEPPYTEFYRVPSITAEVVNTARQAGRRIIAVGTTAIRALETVTDAAGITHPGAGWTDLIITPERGIRSVNGLITGLHEPRATHLAMLEALASREHLCHTYQAALAERYLWHEFGDLHLILP